MVQEQPRELARRARSGTVSLSQVVAANVPKLRRDLGLRQTDLGERMRELGHETWSRQIVSLVERYLRSVNVDELASLSLALEVSPVVLLTPDPDGPPLDLGLPGLAQKLAGALTPAWIAGRRDLRVRWDGNRLTGLGASTTSGHRGRSTRGQRSADPATEESNP